MINQIWNRLQLIFAQGLGLIVSNDKVQVRVLDGEPLNNIDRVEPYGFSYRPKPGCKTYLMFPSGDRSYGVALIIGDKRYQMVLEEGEVALHDDQGQCVYLTRDGIVIKGAGRPIKITDAPEVFADVPLLRCSGDVMDHSEGSGMTMSAMRAVFNQHKHHENGQGGNTSTPSVAME